jgi:2',3'-cyclic-nucleotide 2'-phosphodiesterase (5'-nucleotidase family)
MTLKTWFINCLQEKENEMPRLKKITNVLTLLLVFGSVLCASAQEGKKIYAQKLVDETLAKHKDVVIMAMHVTPPGKTENVIIASNIGRIGKKADEDDLRVIETGKPNLEVNKKGDHFEVELVMQDQSGKTIGAVGIVFNYEKGKEAEFQKNAEQIRDEMKQKTPTLAKLFEPAS